MYHVLHDDKLDGCVLPGHHHVLVRGQGHLGGGVPCLTEQLCLVGVGVGLLPPSLLLGQQVHLHNGNSVCLQHYILSSGLLKRLFTSLLGSTVQSNHLNFSGKHLISVGFRHDINSIFYHGAINVH